MNARVVYSVGVVLWVMSGGAEAQVSETAVEHTETVFTEEALAARWRLSMEEWATYRTLMQGPRGIWSPSLDPITVLGIHAETDAERRRYAELLVMVEFERVEQELLFQRAYDDAAQRLFPTLPRVTLASSDPPAALSGAERLAFFGSVNSKRCPTCRDVLKRWLETYVGHDGPVLDLLGQGVSAAAVRRGRITLNHARGPLAGSMSDSAVSPRLMQRLAGQWLPVSVAQ
jgi:integrating conjugative element protein (TIGR03759 family)